MALIDPWRQPALPRDLELLAARHASRRDDELRQAALARDAAQAAATCGNAVWAGAYEEEAIRHVDAANVSEWLRQQVSRLD